MTMSMVNAFLVGPLPTYKCNFMLEYFELKGRRKVLKKY